MDAENVAFDKSKERLKSDQPHLPRGKRYAENIIRIEAISLLMVEVELDIADPVFSDCLATPLGFVLPQALL
ncbi:MAG: hypothetical protein ACI94O_001573 [Octadecabacter sp.]|jgi:hypothetical protein